MFRFTIDSYRFINNDDLVEFRIRRLPVSTVPLDLTQIFSVIQSADEQTIEVDRAAEYPANLVGRFTNPRVTLPPR